MYAKKVTYEDYNGVTRTETFMFNLTEAEITEMELNTEGGLVQMLNRIIESKDTKEIASVFKTILLKSYGVRSDDGRRFIKSQELRDAFEQNPAYSDIFMELATDADAATKFMNSTMPAKLIQQAQLEEAKNTVESTKITDV